MSAREWIAGIAFAAMIGLFACISDEPAAEVAVPSGASGDGGAEGSTTDAGADTGLDDRPRYVFVTGKRYAGYNAGGAPGLDALCIGEAKAFPKLEDLKWAAWISTKDVSAAERVGLAKYAGTYKLLNDLPVGTSAKILEGTLANAIGIMPNEKQIVGPPTGVWTGTGPDGVLDTNNCTDWTPSDTPALGLTGNWEAPFAAWTNSGATKPCGEQLSLYCFQIE